MPVRFLAVLALASLPLLAQEHVLPGEYFPAFPGSHWKYLDQKGDTVVDSVASTYRPASFPYGQVNRDLAGKSYFLPMLLTSHWASFQRPLRGGGPPTPLIGYRIPYEGGPGGGWASDDFFNDKLDSSWTYQSDSRCGGPYCTWRTVIAVDTSITVLDRVFDTVVAIRTVLPSLYDTTVEFYAKGVGPVLLKRADRSLRLVSWSIGSHTRKSQFIRVDSLHSPQWQSSWRMWGSDALPVFPGGVPTSTPIGLRIEEPAGDSLRIDARTTAGFPVTFELRGVGTAHPGGLVRFPRAFGRAEIVLRHAGDSLHHPAPDYKGSLCFYPTPPKVALERGADGRPVLSTEYEGPGNWVYDPGDGTTETLAGATGRSHVPEYVGKYAFQAIDTASAPHSCPKKVASAWVAWSGQLQVREAGRPAPLQVRALGTFSLAWSGFARGADMEWSLWSPDGASLGRLESRWHREVLEVRSSRALPPGAYVVRACRDGHCRAAFVPVASVP